MEVQENEVLRCSVCDSPVMTTSVSCNACKAALNGTEARYLVYQPHAPGVRPLFIELLLIGVVLLSMESYFPEGGLSMFLILLSGVYAWKIFKRWG